MAPGRHIMAHVYYSCRCMEELQGLYIDLEEWQAALDRWERGHIRAHQELFNLCEDSYDRLQTFSHSLAAQSEDSKAKLKDTFFLLDALSSPLNEILAAIAPVRERLKSKRPYQSEEEHIRLALERIQHSIDCLFEVFPALMHPALTAQNIPRIREQHTRINIGLNDSNLEIKNEHDDSPSQEYRTVYLVGNSACLQGWNWEVVAQIVYQSSRMLPTHMSSSPKVRFAHGAIGIPVHYLEVQEAMDIFASQTPRGDWGVVDRLGECLVDHTSRFGYSTKPLRLQLFVFFSDELPLTYQPMEREILQSGKKLRHLGASHGEVVIHFIQVGADAFKAQYLSYLRHCINVDQALRGTISVQVTVFDIFNVSENTYKDIVLSGLTRSRSHDEEGLVEPSSKASYAMWEIGVRGLSPYTDAVTIDLGFRSYGRVESVKIESTAQDGLFNARIIYDSKEDAETAVESMNTARFDGQIIQVYMIGALSRLKPVESAREDRGVFASLRMP